MIYTKVIIVLLSIMLGASYQDSVASAALVIKRKLSKSAQVRLNNLISAACLQLRNKIENHEPADAEIEAVKDKIKLFCPEEAKWVDFVDISNNSFFSLAIAACNLDMIKKMLAQDPDLSQTNEQGYTPLEQIKHIQSSQKVIFRSNNPLRNEPERVAQVVAEILKLIQEKDQEIRFNADMNRIKSVSAAFKAGMESAAAQSAANGNLKPLTTASLAAALFSESAASAKTPHDKLRAKRVIAEKNRRPKTGRSLERANDELIASGKLTDAAGKAIGALDKAINAGTAAMNALASLLDKAISNSAQSNVTQEAAQSANTATHDNVATRAATKSPAKDKKKKAVAIQPVAQVITAVTDSQENAANRKARRAIARKAQAQSAKPDNTPKPMLIDPQTQKELEKKKRREERAAIAQAEQARQEQERAQARADEAQAVLGVSQSERTDGKLAARSTQSVKHKKFSSKAVKPSKADQRQRRNARQEQQKRLSAQLLEAQREEDSQRLALTPETAANQQIVKKTVAQLEREAEQKMLRDMREKSAKIEQQQADLRKAEKAQEELRVAKAKRAVDMLLAKCQEDWQKHMEFLNEESSDAAISRFYPDAQMPDSTIKFVLPSH